MAEKNSNKLKPKRRKDKQINETEGEDKSYFRWNLQMEQSLAGVLREERQLGHKGDGGWKTVAYNTAASILSAQFNLDVSADNIRNRVKTWKKFYGIVSDILSQSGFSWDATKKMITVDDKNVWEEYVKSHEEAKSFRWKVIANWEDIVDLCGKDRATGEGAETGEEAAQFMTPDNDYNDVVDLEGTTQGFDSINNNDIEPTLVAKKRKGEASSCVQIPKKRISATKDILADSVSRMASSFEHLIAATSKKIDPIDVYNEVNGIPDLSQEEQLKALAWFVENDKQFEMLKAIPLEKKRSLVLMFLSKAA